MRTFPGHRRGIVDAGECHLRAFPGLDYHLSDNGNVSAQLLQILGYFRRWTGKGTRPEYPITATLRRWPGNVRIPVSLTCNAPAMAWKNTVLREYTPSVGRRNSRIRRPQATGTGEILRGTSVPLSALSYPFSLRKQRKWRGGHAEGDEECPLCQV